MEGTLLCQGEAVWQVLKLTASQPVPLKQHLSASLELGQLQGQGRAAKPWAGAVGCTWAVTCWTWARPCHGHHASTAGLWAQWGFSTSSQEMKCWRAEISLCSWWCYLLLQFFSAHTLTLTKTQQIVEFNKAVIKRSGIADGLLSATVLLFDGLRFIIILGWHSSNWQSPWPFAKRIWRCFCFFMALISPEALFLYV